MGCMDAAWNRNGALWVAREEEAPLGTEAHCRSVAASLHENALAQFSTFASVAVSKSHEWYDMHFCTISVDEHGRKSVRHAWGTLTCIVQRIDE